ncbi:MAG: indole-3-glycerol-phosphate synthase [bacterium]|nr:MAG: indole-3-glycerol-phosphate synthase [bacterium]
MNDLLKKILDNKRAEVAFNRGIAALADLKRKAADAPPTRGFEKSIRLAAAKHKVIAEIKRMSPAGGWAARNFDPSSIAKGYEASGAAAISVLTDGLFFGGSAHCLALAKKSVNLPLLRKDFIIDPYQIYESRIIGADAVLIMALNFESKAHAADMVGIALEIGLEVLFEIHDEVGLIPPGVCVGINNRSFMDKNLKVDTVVTQRLAPLLRGNKKLLVSESGIRDSATMEELEKAGADAFLIGSALMKKDDPGKALLQLLR